MRQPFDTEFNQRLESHLRQEEDSRNIDHPAAKVGSIKCQKSTTFANNRVMDNTSAWTPPVYTIARPPQLEYTAPVDPELPTNYARAAKWCPDGHVALAQCEDAAFRYLDITECLLRDTPTLLNKNRKSLPQPSPVLDFAWYPYATSNDLASFCFLASVRECPVKLLDATDGRLRASYKIVDHRERHIAPHSLAFNTSATKIYCGFEDAIEIFDVHSPGEGSRWRTTPSKKSKDGLKGIISSLVFSTDPSSGVFAAGSLNPSAPSSSNIALFTETNGEIPVMFVGDESAGTGFGIRSSVNQLMFNPSRPYILYASFRRHNYIYAWDLRGDVTTPVQRFSRNASETARDNSETNQRLRFDVDIGGKWLAIGDQGGSISLFDLDATGDEVQPGSGTTVCSNAALTYTAHDDAVGSVAFHPSRSLLLSVSGSRHYADAPGQDIVDTTSDASDLEENTDAEDGPHELAGPSKQGTMITRSRTKRLPVARDNSSKIWSFA